MKLTSEPRSALEKLISLGDCTRVLTARATEAKGKLEALRATINGRNDNIKPEQIKRVRAELEALVPLVPQLEKQVADAQAVFAACKKYIGELADGSELVPVHVDANGYDLQGCRDRLVQIANEERELRAAPSPSSDIEARVRNYVREMGARGLPIVHKGFEGGELAILWPATDFNARNLSGTDTLRCNPLFTLCWAFPEVMVARLMGRVEQQAQKPLPPQARPAQLAALAAEAMHLRYVEERLIVEAHD